MTPVEAMKQKHYSVPELHKMWGWDPKIIRELFENEEGVFVVERPERVGKNAKRKYCNMRIPESVAARVYAHRTTRACSPGGTRGKSSR